MKKFLFIALLLIAGGSAFAQQQKGDFQVQAQAAYYNLDGFDFGNIYFNASRFVTDNVEIGVSPNITISTVTSVNMTVFGNYSFLTADAKMVPYVGAGITFYDLGSDQALTGFTLKGGLRYFVTERVNIDVGPNLVLLEGANLFILNAGLGYIFGKRG
jgi:outer membrane protein W